MVLVKLLILVLSDFYIFTSCALLTGISERVADIKTRAHAMKCLTTFSEAMGPEFIFERVSQVSIGLEASVSLFGLI